MDGKQMLDDTVGTPVNLPAPNVGVEEPVIGKERWEEIRRMRLRWRASRS